MKDEYSDMLEKYNLLLEENKKLKAELALLKDKTGLVMPEAEATPQISISSINKHSSPEEKSIFSVLFSKAEKMSLLAVGTVKLRIKAVISLFVKTSGMRSFATRKNISVPFAPTANL